MSSKSLYLDNRNHYREQIKISNDIDALNKLEKGYERWKKYSDQWIELDLDEYVNKLFLNPRYHNEGQKFIIDSDESNYIIYCDNSCSYFRIGDKNYPTSDRRHYLDKDLKHPLNEIVNGKQRGMSREDREKITHFKMKRKKEG